MNKPKMSNEWIDIILGALREKLYQEGYQRGMKRCHNEGREEYYVPFFAEGFVQGCAEALLIQRCECAIKENIPFSEIAESYHVTEIELKNLYFALISERKANGH